MSRPRTMAVLLAVACCAAASGRAAEAFRYPEGVHGQGSLKYINELPVVTVVGSPQEMGEQLGALALKPATPLIERADEMLAHYGWKQLQGLALSVGNVLVPQIPPAHLQELDAAVAEAGWPRDLLLFGNTVLDLRRIVQCSAVIAEGSRSATGGPLFGRNLDWPPVAGLEESTLVIVYRPTGKHAFASIAFPGTFGCTSGMNDAGLAVALLDAAVEKPGSVNFNPAGMPMIMLARRLLEECTTVEEAAALVRSVERASSFNFAVCDRTHGVVFELTPQAVELRKSEDGVCLCTNHFRSPELATSMECWRYEKLAGEVGEKQYAVADIARRLHDVNQGEATLQSMVFEPSALKLHLAFGKGPASRLPMHELELSNLFGDGSDREPK
jgi:isopenicillin-N N-acyltransferase-like protein